MKHKLLLSLLATFLFFQCANVEKTNNQSEEKTFESFFKDFSANQDFQLASIDFPLEYYSVDIMDELEKGVIEKSDWNYIDFTKDEDAKAAEIDAYEVVVEKTVNEVKYARKGIDNGILITYYFKMRDSKWYLVKIVDQSS